VRASNNNQDRTLISIYDRLYDHYGPQDWWPADSDLEIIISAILTQSASWRNVEKALNALKVRNLMDVDALRSIDQSRLAQVIRPSGYFNAKAAKIKAFVAMLDEHYRGRLGMLLSEPLDAIRERLIATPGIGPETADAIVLYAAGLPTFVIDAYTRRIMRRIGLGPANDSYEDWRRFFLESLPADPTMFNEYHALLVAHGKALCQRHYVLCESCPLLSLCATGEERLTTLKSRSGRPPGRRGSPSLRAMSAPARMGPAPTPASGDRRPARPTERRQRPVRRPPSHAERGPR
jgi:endonuclease-3 related protein